MELITLGSDSIILSRECGCLYGLWGKGNPWVFSKPLDRRGLWSKPESDEDHWSKVCLGNKVCFHLCIWEDAVGNGRVCLSFPSEETRCEGGGISERSNTALKKGQGSLIEIPTSFECPSFLGCCILNNSFSISCLFMNFFMSVFHSYLVAILKCVAISHCW